MNKFKKNLVNHISTNKDKKKKIADLYDVEKRQYSEQTDEESADGKDSFRNAFKINNVLSRVDETDDDLWKKEDKKNPFEKEEGQLGNSYKPLRLLAKPSLVFEKQDLEEFIKRTSLLDKQDTDNSVSSKDDSVNNHEGIDIFDQVLTTQAKKQKKFINANSVVKKRQSQASMDLTANNTAFSLPKLQLPSQQISTNPFQSQLPKASLSIPNNMGNNQNIFVQNQNPSYNSSPQFVSQQQISNNSQMQSNILSNIQSPNMSQSTFVGSQFNQYQNQSNIFVPQTNLDLLEEIKLTQKVLKKDAQQKQNKSKLTMSQLYQQTFSLPKIVLPSEKIKRQQTMEQELDEEIDPFKFDPEKKKPLPKFKHNQKISQNYTQQQIFKEYQKQIKQEQKEKKDNSQPNSNNVSGSVKASKSEQLNKSNQQSQNSSHNQSSQSQSNNNNTTDSKIKTRKRKSNNQSQLSTGRISAKNKEKMMLASKVRMSQKQQQMYDMIYIKGKLLNLIERHKDLINFINDQLLITRDQFCHQAAKLFIILNGASDTPDVSEVILRVNHIVADKLKLIYNQIYKDLNIDVIFVQAFLKRYPIMIKEFLTVDIIASLGGRKNIERQTKKVLEYVQTEFPGLKNIFDSNIERIADIVYEIANNNVFVELNKGIKRGVFHLIKNLNFTPFEFYYAKKATFQVLCQENINQRIVFKLLQKIQKIQNMVFQKSFNIQRLTQLMYRNQKIMSFFKETSEEHVEALIIKTLDCLFGYITYNQLENLLSILITNVDAKFLRELEQFFVNNLMHYEMDNKNPIKYDILTQFEKLRSYVGLKPAINKMNSTIIKKYLYILTEELIEYDADVTSVNSKDDNNNRRKPLKIQLAENNIQMSELFDFDFLTIFLNFIFSRYHLLCTYDIEPALYCHKTKPQVFEFQITKFCKILKEAGEFDREDFEEIKNYIYNHGVHFLKHKIKK